MSRGPCRAFFRLLEGKEQGYVNFQNSKGVTALNIASHRGNVQFVTALLEKAKVRLGPDRALSAAGTKRRALLARPLTLLSHLRRPM